MFVKKISVLMPSYNDCDTLCETLDSLICQSYKNWELVIIDDGSTDNTCQVVKDYKKKYDKHNKIKYIYQDNSDQLLAIINGLSYVDGDYIYILHSDDLLYDENTFAKAVDYFDKNSDVDCIIGDLVIIDENSNVTGVQKVYKYEKKKKIPAIQLLWLGRNLYVDLGFYKREVFEKNLYNNYLVWDKPFWLDTEDKINMVNVKKVNFSLFKYRIYSGNYSNDEIGKLCLINGELRTATQHINFFLTTIIE